MLGVFRNPVLVVGALIVGVLLVFGGSIGALTGSVVPPEESLEYTGMIGSVKLAGGVDGRGETFVTAGDPGQASQSVTASGSLRAKPGLGFSNVCAYKYRVLLNGVEQPHLGSAEKAMPGGFGEAASLEPHVFYFTGIVTGILKVELYAKVGRITCGSYGHVASDGARLVSGAGTVALATGQSNLAEEGQTVKFQVRAGAGTWTLQVFNGLGEPSCGIQGGGFKPAQVPAWEQGTSSSSGGSSSSGSCRASLSWTGEKNGVVEFVVPTGVFREDGKNSWNVVLRNTLVDHSSAVLFVVDKKIKAPEPPRVTVSNAKPNVGDMVTLTLESRANPQTQAAVKQFEVYVWYGTLDVFPPAASPNWIARGVTVPATHNGAAYVGTYTFKVTAADVIQYHATAYDTAGRPSGSSLNEEDRGNLEAQGLPEANGEANGEVRPEGSGRAVGPQAPPNTTESGFVFIVILVSAVALLLLWRYAPAPQPAKIGLALLLIGGVGYYVLNTLGGAL